MDAVSSPPEAPSVPWIGSSPCSRRRSLRRCAHEVLDDGEFLRLTLPREYRAPQQHEQRQGVFGGPFARSLAREAIPFFFCSSSFLPLHTRAQVAVAHIGEAEHFNPSHPLEGVARGAPTVRTLARPACTACLLSFQSNPFLSLVPPFSLLSCFLFSLSTLFFPLFPSFFFSVCFLFSFFPLFPSFFFSEMFAFFSVFHTDHRDTYDTTSKSLHMCPSRAPLGKRKMSLDAIA